MKNELKMKAKAKGNSKEFAEHREKRKLWKFEWWAKSVEFSSARARNLGARNLGSTKLEKSFGLNTRSERGISRG
jgi:hypothetical protein